MLDVRFQVEGTPVSKGSMSGFPIDRGPCPTCKPGKPCRGRSCFGGRSVGVSVTDQGGKELDAWEELTFVRAMSARNRAGCRPIARPGSCEVTLIFILPRPDSHWTKSGRLTADGRAREMPSVKPDLDKLGRAVIDGLTRVLVEDDAQIVVAPLAEVYADRGKWTGVCVRARQISGPPAWVVEELAHHCVWAPSAQEALL
jgi:Holliday junction resolvase RusA-like endonuclease